MSQYASEAVVILSYRTPPSQACTLGLATIGVYDVTLDPVHKASCRLRALPVLAQRLPLRLDVLELHTDF